jgi:hypothetical protein
MEPSKACTGIATSVLNTTYFVIICFKSVKMVYNHLASSSFSFIRLYVTSYVIILYAIPLYMSFLIIIPSILCYSFMSLFFTCRLSYSEPNSGAQKCGISLRGLFKTHIAQKCYNWCRGITE